MKLLKNQQVLYDAFYESTECNEVLTKETELLVGLAAAMATNCEPCTAYYLRQCQNNGVTYPQVQSVLAKVMAVAAGQKRLQTERVLRDFRISKDSFEGAFDE